MKIYDISVPVSNETPTFPGDPRVEITTCMAIARGDAANVSALNFGAHTATHVDAPAHFIEGGRRIADLPLENFVGRARVIEIPDDRAAIEAPHVAPEIIENAARLLFKTRNSKFWHERPLRFRENFTYLSPEAARIIARSNVQLVGIDYLSIEEFHSGNFDAHLALLEREIVIVEGLDLSGVAAGDYELCCLPLKIESECGDGAPARAVLREFR